MDNSPINEPNKTENNSDIVIGPGMHQDSNNHKDPIKSRFLKFATIAILIACILVGGYYLLNMKQDKQIQIPQSSDTIKHKATIEITKDGFVPSVLLVEPGTEVTWINNDTEPHYVASNPYRDRSENPTLDSQEAIGPAGTYTFTVGEHGKVYNYHDDYNPEHNASIIVE